MSNNLLLELEQAVARREKLGKMVIIFSLPKFKQSSLSWVLSGIENRN